MISKHSNANISFLSAFIILGFTAVNIYLFNYYNSNDNVIKRFKQIFSNSELFDQHKFLGIKCIQNPNDVWITQEIIQETKPDYIIETGSWLGGSAALWATLLGQINPAGKVISIDIQDWVTDARKLPIVQEKVEFLVGSSTDPKIVAHIASEVAGKKVLVILDSDHSAQHVLNEIHTYGPMVNVGSYIIVQDTQLGGHPIEMQAGEHAGPGPYEAVEQFIPSQNNFEIDTSRERLILTWNPRGFLKRVR